jgi:hypothetical protein
LSAGRAAQAQIASRQLRGEMLRSLLAARDRAPTPSRDDRGAAKAILNIEPELPHAAAGNPRAEAAQRRVEPFPTVPVARGDLARFPLEVQAIV